jgi:ABC-type lipoprotein export system ATPase subunit
VVSEGSNVQAMNKLEKVALKLARKKGRPLVFIFNNVHLLNNNEGGRNILLQLQQRAETWAESG